VCYEDEFPPSLTHRRSGRRKTAEPTLQHTTLAHFNDREPVLELRGGRPP